jgi:hypothetical protein
MALTPFGLSLSKPLASRHRPFDKLRANGGDPFGLSLSKPCCHMHQPFDKLRANGSGQ